MQKTMKLIFVSRKAKNRTYKRKLSNNTTYFNVICIKKKETNKKIISLACSHAQPRQSFDAHATAAAGRHRPPTAPKWRWTGGISLGRGLT